MDLVRIATLVRRTLGMQRGSVAHLRMVLKTNHLAGMVRRRVQRLLPNLLVAGPSVQQSLLPSICWWQWGWLGGPAAGSGQVPRSERRLHIVACRASPPSKLTTQSPASAYHTFLPVLPLKGCPVPAPPASPSFSPASPALSVTGRPLPSQERPPAQPRQAERAGSHHLLLPPVQRQGALPLCGSTTAAWGRVRQCTGASNFAQCCSAAEAPVLTRRCSCNCIAPNVRFGVVQDVSASEFEEHSGSKDRRPADGIFMEGAPYPLCLLWSAAGADGGSITEGRYTCPPACLPRPAGRQAGWVALIGRGAAPCTGLRMPIRPLPATPGPLQPTTAA